MGSFVGPAKARDIPMGQDRPGTPRNAGIAAAPVAIFLILYIVLLGVRPLVIPDETRYAEIAREMLASHDWIVPRLNGMRYFEKPVLGHWLNAAALRLFGENAFAVRFPSAAAAGLTALLLWVWARRFRGLSRAGPPGNAIALLAVTVFLLSFEVFALGVFCLLDSLLSLFVTAAIVLLDFAYDQRAAGARMLLLMAAGLACGLAFLTKGFLALAIPVVVIGPFVLWQGRLRVCLRTAWVPLVVAGLTVLPWGIAIYRREPDFWHYFFWTEHVQRFFWPQQAQHPFPFWFYVPILVGSDAVDAFSRHDRSGGEIRRPQEPDDSAGRLLAGHAVPALFRRQRQARHVHPAVLCASGLSDRRGPARVSGARRRHGFRHWRLGLHRGHSRPRPRPDRGSCRCPRISCLGGAMEVGRRDRRTFALESACPRHHPQDPPEACI